MKRLPRILLATLLAACGASAALLAQAPPAPKPAAASAPIQAPPLAPKPAFAPMPAPPPNDPFVRDVGAPKKSAEALAAQVPAAAVNLLTTLETWSLSQADFTALLEGPADERAPYERLEELAKAGKAKLIGLMALNTKSGQRAVVQVIDEVRYPTEFDPAKRAGEMAFPTAWETRNTGDTLEIEPVVGPDGKTIDLNLVPQSVRLERFQDWQPEPAAAPMGKPIFRTEKITTSMSVHSGRPAFLTTATPVEAADAQGVKQVRIRTVRVAAQPVAPSPPFNGEPSFVGRVELLVYSLDREAARRILTSAADSVQSYAALRGLLAKGEAQLETVSALVTKSGQRAINEETVEFTYPTVFNPPTYGAAQETRQPASALAFETRNTGVQVEIEPMFGPENRLVDINVVPQIVTFAGLLKATGAAEKYPPQPVFTTRKVTTSVASGAGVPVLLGTLSQPRDTGVNDRQDDGRTSLAYIRVTPVRP